MKRLEDEADLEGAIRCRVRQLRYRVSSIAQSSRGGSIERAEHLKQGGLSATARTGNGDELALRDSKIHASQCLHLAVVEIFPQPFASNTHAAAWSRDLAMIGSWPKVRGGRGTAPRVDLHSRRWPAPARFRGSRRATGLPREGQPGCGRGPERRANSWGTAARSSGRCGLEHRDKLRQFRVRKSRMPMMHAMIRLVEQRERRRADPANRQIRCSGWNCSPSSR